MKFHRCFRCYRSLWYKWNLIKATEYRELGEASIDQAILKCEARSLVSDTKNSQHSCVAVGGRASLGANLHLHLPWHTRHSSHGCQRLVALERKDIFGDYHTIETVPNQRNQTISKAVIHWALGKCLCKEVSLTLSKVLFLSNWPLDYIPELWPWSWQEPSSIASF